MFRYTYLITSGIYCRHLYLHNFTFFNLISLVETRTGNNKEKYKNYRINRSLLTYISTTCRTKKLNTYVTSYRLSSLNSVSNVVYE